MTADIGTTKQTLLLLKQNMINGTPVSFQHYVKFFIRAVLVASNMNILVQNQKKTLLVAENKGMFAMFLSHQSPFFKVFRLGLRVDKDNLAKASLDLF